MSKALMVLLIFITSYDSFSGLMIEEDGYFLQKYEDAECLESLPDGIKFAEEEFDSVYELPEKEFLASQFSREVRSQIKDLLPNDPDNEDHLDAYLEKYIRYDNMKEVGKSNSGVIKSNLENMKNNGCFSLLAEKFYKELKNLPSNRKRPKIDDETRNKNQVWSLALKIADGNVNLAMELVGLCGHDDINQGQGTEYLNNLYTILNPKQMTPFLNKSITLCQAQLETCGAKTANYIADINEDETIFYTPKDCDVFRTISDREKVYCGGFLPDLISDLEKIRSGEIKLQKIITCPVKQSALFDPGSFPFDIDKDLKERILASHGKDILFKHAKPPAKYYHQTGSAAITCDLIKKGMDPKKAVNTQVLFATAYRSVRICTTRKSDQKNFEQVESFLNSSRSASEAYKKIKTEFGKDKKLLKSFRHIGLGEEIFQDEELFKAKYESLKGYLVASKMYAKRTIKDPKATSLALEQEYGKDGKNLLKKLSSRLADGAGFFEKMKKAGAEKAGFTVADRECIMNNLALHLKPSAQLSCPDGTSREVCKLAKKKLESWDIDMEWTRKSQKSGAEFAAKNCTKATGKETQSSCEALNKLTAQK